MGSDTHTRRTSGQCRLCLTVAELQDSHFIPQAAYKLVRGAGKNPHPLHVQKDKVVQTSAQLRGHLLCHECEQRLHRNGEDAFFKYCYRGPGNFRLLDVLRQQAPLIENERTAIYAVPISEASAIEQIGFMGTSLFWKAAAHLWRDQRGMTPSISLGTQYQEELRQFLLGQCSFPNAASVIVEVSDENNRLIAVVGTPASSKFPTHYLHWLDICGIRFNLLIGPRTPSSLKGLSVFRPVTKYVLLAKKQEAAMTSDYHDLLQALADSAKS